MRRTVRSTNSNMRTRTATATTSRVTWRPAGPPWNPAVMVPETALAVPPPISPPSVDVRPLLGKGMWLWKYDATENGDADAIVTKAVAAGLHQLWVRVGDSKDGFYAAKTLDELVPRAHRRGLAVVGWGFPYLYDPVADAGWTQQVLGWRG